MKRLLALLLLSSTAFATTTVTGHIQTLGAGGVSNGAFVRFWLRGCGGNQPTVSGSGVIAPSQGGVFYFDIPAGASGAVSGTIYSTRDATGNNGGDISCGGSTTSVWYGMQIFQAGKGGPEVAIHAKNTATLDITNVTPLTTNPVVTAPTGDTTYARLDGGNQPFSGSLTPSGNATLNLGGSSKRWEGFFDVLNANGLLDNALTASVPVCSDASKNLTSTCPPISNGQLTNSSVTYNGQAVALGASGNVNSGASAHSMALNEGAGTAITGLPVGADQVAIGKSSADPTASSLPNCTDTSGQHLNYATGGTFTCGTTSSTLPSFNAPTRVTLGSPVGMSATTQTTILSTSFTTPSATGTYRLLFTYGLWITAGSNLCAAEVIDNTNSRVFALSGQNANGTGYIGLSGSELSTQTYAANTTITVHLDAECNNAASGLSGATVNMNQGLIFTMSPAEPTYLSVTAVLSN